MRGEPLEKDSAERDLSGPQLPKRSGTPGIARGFGKAARKAQTETPPTIPPLIVDQVRSAANQAIAFG